MLISAAIQFTKRTGCCQNHLPTQLKCVTVSYWYHYAEYDGICYGRLNLSYTEWKWLCWRLLFYNIVLALSLSLSHLSSTLVLPCRKEPNVMIT